jgi:hypothetical protein
MRPTPAKPSPRFRRPLALKLAISFALSAVAATLIIGSGQSLGSARFPVLLLGMFGSFTFLKVMLATAWTDPSALPLERRLCRALIYTLALIFALLLLSRVHAAPHS